jgi:glycosyltransferase involved in cell wall biosynthesis
MAGVGIRCWELANVLSACADVTLAAIRLGPMPPSSVTLVSFEPHSPHALRPHVRAADLVVCQPQWPVVTAWLRRCKARVVYDLYDPESFETIELYAHRSARLRGLMVDLAVDRLNAALESGDHFICASEKQRDLWLGAMYSRRLISAKRYDRDPSFRSVIDVVPFGLPARPPEMTDPRAIYTSIPGLPADGEIVLWNGGIWNWLDAPGAVRAFALLAQRRPHARLVFMGATSNPAGRRASEEALAIAGRERLLDRVVFFNSRWVPYADRANWLLAANCALSLHQENLETRFAFRTRLLDCFWAGLPVVCTEGDELAERVQREQLGETVPAGDDEAVAAALARVLERGRESYADALARVAADYAWPRAAGPLIGFLRSREARDRLGDATPGPLRAEIGFRLRRAAYRLGHRVIRAGFAGARHARRIARW